jgi:two-component system OmpR family sensor kinase
VPPLPGPPGPGGGPPGLTGPHVPEEPGDDGPWVGRLRPGLARTWGRTPLWLRLVSALLVLALVSITLTAGFGARLLRGYLIGRVDRQLVQASESLDGAELIAQMRAGSSSPPSAFNLTFLDASGQTVVSVVGGVPGAHESPELPSLTPAEARDRAGRPFGVSSEGSGSSWRVLAVPFENSSGTLLIATSLEDVDATVRRLVKIDLIVGALVLAGLAVVATTMVRTAMRPLTNIERTAAAIARGDLARRVPDADPSTEVGRLGEALNRMLEQIESAFHAREASESRARGSEERMRRFVADASHELRTPLTSIRGFAELHRQGAVTDPEAVTRLLGRIEDEATRMGLLVEDLLLLARLDQQRPMQRSPVDLVVLAADAVESARTLSPDRDIRLVAASPSPDEPAGVVVTGDEGRLRQVVSNLVDNARTHTPAGTAIEVRVWARDGRAVLEVADQGQGLTPEQAERVFERFYRTDAARSRAQGGTGLGLSIVAAIAAAHGGTVTVDTAAGEGATFRVNLPLA